MAEILTTRSAALALADERALMRQGYQFLDEKRMLLAAEMLRALARHQALEDQLRERLLHAQQTLRQALQRHGLDGLQAYPPAAPPPAAPRLVRSRFLGVPLLAAELEAQAPSDDGAWAANTAAANGARVPWKTCCCPRSRPRSRPSKSTWNGPIRKTRCACAWPTRDQRHDKTQRLASQRYQQAKVAAAAIIELLAGRAPNTQPVVMNTCYSFVDAKSAIHVASIHQYSAEQKTMVTVPGSGGVSGGGATELEGSYAMAWAQNIWADMLA